MSWHHLLFILLGFACGEAQPRSRLLSDAQADVASLSLRSDCQRAEFTCTRCHTLARILVAEAHARSDWEPVVTKMRLMTASGITKNDEDSVLRCLDFRGTAR